VTDQPQYEDVLVVTDDRTHPEMATAQPAGRRAVALAAGLTIEQLSHEYAERVIAACTPRGENYDPTRQFN
jgi:hypothetical protein